MRSRKRIVVEQLIPGVTKLALPIEWQIVGVYRDVHNGGRASRWLPEIDVPFWQSPLPQAGVAVRTFGDPAGMAKSITGDGALCGCGSPVRPDQGP